MPSRLKNKNSAGCGKTSWPVEFVTICVFAFVGSVLATGYFCHSMSGKIKMPGGWTMSMMWMRMPGETCFVSTLSFLLMWLAMMVAMMMPSALPMFLKTRRNWRSLYYMACGYFSVWLGVGIAVYLLGVGFTMAAVSSKSICTAIPLLSAASLIGAGAVQFTGLKMINLLHCRSSFICAILTPRPERSFHLGCKQGVRCCISCIGPMAIQLAFGVMNPVVMLVVGVIIAAEKLLPRPEITARIVGIAAVFAAFALIFQSSMSPAASSTNIVSCAPAN